MGSSLYQLEKLTHTKMAYVVQQPVAVAQPVMMANVVTQQPVAQPAKKDWDKTLCQSFCCGGGFSKWFCTAVCFEIYTGCQIKRADESFLLCLCPGAPIMALRSKLRGKHNLSGDICGDAFALACCLPCVACQTWAQMDAEGYPQ